MVPVFLFSTIPFPSLSESPLKQRIRDLGEKLDDLDEAVLEAYGWSDLATTPPYQWHDRPGHEPQRADDPDDSQPTPENSSTHHDPDGRATGSPLADQLAKKDETAEAIEQELLPHIGPDPTARERQITEILQTLTALGKL